MPKQSTTPFTYYSFRYDYNDMEKLNKIKKYIEVNIPKYAIFDEISSEVGKTHIQGKIGLCLSLVQLKKNLKKEFPNEFIKSNYSIAIIKKPDEYDSYIAKDGKVFMNNCKEFTEEYINAQVEKHKQKVSAFEKKNEKIESKLKTKTFVMEVTDDFIEKYPMETEHIRSAYNSSDYLHKYHREACEDLLCFLLTRLGKVSKVFDDNILQRMYTGIKNGIVQRDPLCSRRMAESYENRINL